MSFSYTQIAQYLRCPRSYRHRYLDGWREKETRAAMVFGRCFEKALEAYFCGSDCGALFIGSGALTAILRLITKKVRPGIDWFIRGCIYSSALPKTIEFAFLSRNRISSSKWSGNSRAQINLLPTLTPSVNSMAAVALWTGRPQPARYPEEPDRVAVTRPAVDLLFLDDRDFRSGLGCLRTKASTGDPISEDIDFGRTTPGIWPAGGGNDRPDRSRAVSFPQRDSFPTERLRELLTSRALPR